MRATSRLLLVLALAVALLAGCGGSPASAPAPGSTTGPTGGPTSPRPTAAHPAASIGRYVALGDSYTSAPLVPITDANTICLRSDHNYPHLLAAALPVERLVDVSCSGAQTNDLTGSQKGLRPQLDSVTPDTGLVTVGIGGNDVGAISVVLYECPQLRSRDPQGAPCRSQTDGWIHDAIRTVRGRVAAVLAKVRARAPKARVIAVTYPQVIGDRSCAALPLAAGDVGFAHAINHELDQAIVAAARDAHVESLDLWAPSAGHDVCSKDPWINGVRTVPGRALALHPFAVEQRAVADLLARRIRSER